MSYAASQPAYTLHLLRPEKLLFQALALGDVMGHDGHCDRPARLTVHAHVAQNPDLPTILRLDLVLHRLRNGLTDQDLRPPQSLLLLAHLVSEDVKYIHGQKLLPRVTQILAHHVVDAHELGIPHINFIDARWGMLDQVPVSGFALKQGPLRSFALEITCYHLASNSKESQILIAPHSALLRIIKTHESHKSTFARTNRHDKDGAYVLGLKDRSFRTGLFRQSIDIEYQNILVPPELLQPPREQRHIQILEVFYLGGRFGIAPLVCIIRLSAPLSELETVGPIRRNGFTKNFQDLIQIDSYSRNKQF